MVTVFLHNFTTHSVRLVKSRILNFYAPSCTVVSAINKMTHIDIGLLVVV